MRCVEVFINGKLVCRAGGKNVDHIHNILGYVREEDRFQFSSNGNVSADENYYEQVHWIKGIELKAGDSVELKIADSVEVTAYKFGHGYGTIDTDGVTKHYCNFCSREATVENGMLISRHANICHKCLRTNNPDKNA